MRFPRSLEFLLGCSTALSCADAQHVSAPAVPIVEELRLDPNVEDFSVVRNLE